MVLQTAGVAEVPSAASALECSVALKLNSGPRTLICRSYHPAVAGLEVLHQWGDGIAV